MFYRDALGIAMQESSSENGEEIQELLSDHNKAAAGVFWNLQYGHYKGGFVRERVHKVK